MKFNAINHILIEIDQDYLNEKTFDSGVKLITNITIESVRHINRQAKVVTAPESLSIQAGDELIIHHNVARRKNDATGNEIRSQFHIEGNLYFIPPPYDLVFAYKRDKEWLALDPYCFVKPIEIKRPDQVKGLIVPPSVTFGYKDRVPNQAIMKWTNKELSKEGIVEGAKIMHSKYAEYEFEVDGELLYRIKTSHVMGLIED